MQFFCLNGNTSIKDKHNHRHNNDKHNHKNSSVYGSKHLYFNIIKQPCLILPYIESSFVLLGYLNGFMSPNPHHFILCLPQLDIICIKLFIIFMANRNNKHQNVPIFILQ